MKIIRFLFLFLLLLSLAGCGSEGGSSSGNPKVEITPTATADALGYRAVGPSSCLVSDFATVQTDRRQGNLLAWMPGEHTLAFLVPQRSSGWYIGSLALAVEPDFHKPIILTGNLQASGDITWSPDGKRLAFLAFRINEGIQTVMTVRADGEELIDLFPLDQARSDSGTSQKAVLKWAGSDTIVVVSSCGDDCQQEDTVRIAGGAAAPSSTQQRKNASATPMPTRDTRMIKVLDGLEVDANEMSFDPKRYPRGFSSPNWSPDQSKILFLDREGILWLLNTGDKTRYILDIGLRIVNETKWSSDGKLVAVRAEDRVFIFETPCVSKPNG